MPKYIVTHWNIATINTQEIIANSPEDAVINAGYSNGKSLQKCETRSINDCWDSDENKYYAGIREIYAIEYQCNHNQLPAYFYEMFNNDSFGVYSFKIVNSNEEFNFYDAKVGSDNKFIHPLMVGRLLNENERSNAKYECCGDSSLEVFCNNKSILKLP